MLIKHSGSRTTRNMRNLSVRRDLPVSTTTQMLSTCSFTKNFANSCIYKDSSNLPTPNEFKFSSLISNDRKSIYNVKGKRKCHVAFKEFNYTTIIPAHNIEEDVRENERLLHKLHKNIANYNMLSTAKKDILLEKEIGVMKMVEIFNSVEEKENANSSNSTVVPLPKQPKKPSVLFSNKWIEEWESVTTQQKSLIYTQAEDKEEKFQNQHNVTCIRDLSTSRSIVTEATLMNKTVKPKSNRLVNELVSTFKRLQAKRFR
jgi:hypothetical protein